MTDLYTCSCGNQSWQIFENGVRCTMCHAEYPVQHAPVLEFNRAVAHFVQEELEQA